ncbi:fimbrial protein [Mixta theicola]|uniref:Fimbrial protein n=1 Tax=Mixta theicola TaxID=1458355 RepID=A0A2K1QC10_9GAMM|nr:fimbrial protein [Mixta theicola]PNS12536.1 fimbrial protein [Mixta theicola]GLR10097.1 fimbrial protein [Mixta theicola]
MRVKLILLYLFVSFSGLAVTPITINTGSNNYMFIENDVDGGYFITPNSFSPRFTGSNVWTKFPTKQTSLGFLGYIWSWPNYYFDMWIENSPINTPFQGLRCITTGANCPASGYIAGEIIDENGFYHTRGGNSEENGSYAYGSLTDSAYHYFASRPVGASDEYIANICVTTTDYDYSTGIRCKDLMTNAIWRAVHMTLTKAGHLTLNHTNPLAEIWVASDGTPSTSLNADNCFIAVVNNISGITCRMVSYNYERSADITSSLVFGMVLNTTTLGFNPEPSSIKFSGDGATWYNYNSSTAYKNIFKQTGAGYVYVFLSKTFLKNLVDKGISITNNDSMFTFSFTNGIVYYSGYYQFTASSSINIVPKEYGISLISSNSAGGPDAPGIIGSDRAIEFEYTVTTSASRQADSITAQVIGDTTTLSGVPYCIFSSPDNSYKVPVPAYLSYTSQSGATVRERNSCGEPPVNMTNALWTQTAWDASASEGYYFATKLQLAFPMNDILSESTLDGGYWTGTVNASGELKVTATWIGVDHLNLH